MRQIYFRQERQGMLLGTYEPRSTPWKVDGTPWDFGHELLNPDLDLDRFMWLEMSFERIPAIGNAGIKNIINGLFTFGPDGNNDWTGAGDAKLLGCGWRYGCSVRAGGWSDHGGMDD